MLVHGILQVDNLKSGSIYKPAVILAATLGHYEVLDEILNSFPSAIWCLDKDGHDLFQIAVINRRETIFNLLYDLDEHAHLVTQNTDINKNNMLHLVGKLAPPHRLNRVVDTALQMQRELQWYKEVEKFVTPSYKGKENSDGKTPSMVFTEEHKELVVEGEQWLNDTAKSCTFATTLIATVVFAAAITMPGGSSTKSGLPTFEKKSPFAMRCPCVHQWFQSRCSCSFSTRAVLKLCNLHCLWAWRGVDSCAHYCSRLCSGFLVFINAISTC